MLMERLFSEGVMKMGPSRSNPDRQVGVFNPDYVAGLAPLRTAEMQKFRWLAGDWVYQNEVPATNISPMYTDEGTCRFSMCERETWICLVAPDGRETPQITFDPFSRQWIYVLIQGSYGILRSGEGWNGQTISFTGTMTMLGITCEWRMTWTREADDRFSFTNEEQDAAGSWLYIDCWRFQRKLP